MSGSEAEKMQVKIVGALTGDLICHVLADPEWTVQRLKTEIMNVEGTAVLEQHLAFESTIAGAGRPLADSESLGSLALQPQVSVKLLRKPAAKPLQLHGRRGVTVTQLESGLSRVDWTVDTARFQKKDKQVVAPTFEVDLGGKFQRAAFKLMIMSADAQSFQKANGVGHLMLKCENNASVSLRVFIGDGIHFKESLGPYFHNFGKLANCSALKDELLDFAKIGAASKKVCIRLEMQHHCD